MASIPPPLPPRPTDASSITSSDTVDAIERDLSEQQLRDLYDSEEIDRFLSLFSAYVTEVHLQDIGHAGMDSAAVNSASSRASTSSLPQTEFPEWTSVEVSRPSSPLSRPAARNISEAIAQRYLIPILPAAPPPLPLFTLGRLRLTTQRLYLAIQPVYGPFFASLLNLATWEEKQKSSIYCIVFWFLWYQNLLLPCLFLRILYSLARRKLFPYPTLAELRAHRQEIDRANEFGQELSTRISASSSLGVKELWRLFRVFNKSKKEKVRQLASDKTRDRAPQDPLLDDQDPDKEISTVLDSEESTKLSQENDVKRAILQSLADVADLHERVKNIFIWRRPSSSKIYGMVLLFLFIITLFVPAKYLAKLTYFIGGFLFWHVAPVIAALPPSDRARLAPAFSDVPTDAEYAMELISQRVAAGLDIRPVRSQRAEAREKNERDGGVADKDAAHQPAPPKKDKDIDWKKWGERAAVGMTWAEDGKRIFTNGQWPKNTSRAAYSSVETHTFPAQHTSAPGLITLTAETLFFTPLMSSTAKLQIPLGKVRGVKKKSSIFSALTITWVDVQGNGKEEKFPWVGGRDELFARLVGAADEKRSIKI